MEKMILAGFGGQGIMSMGKMMAYAGMVEGNNVTWMPSYGPEMRGGTANCNVIVSEKEIAAPMVDKATVAVVMNKPSMDKFEHRVAPGGKLFVNSSLIDMKSERDDIDVYYIPASDMANELGNVRVANMILLGAVLSETGVIKKETMPDAMNWVLGKGKAHLIEINEKAIEKGIECVMSHA